MGTENKAANKAKAAKGKIKKKAGHRGRSMTGGQFNRVRPAI